MTRQNDNHSPGCISNANKSATIKWMQMWTALWQNQQSDCPEYISNWLKTDTVLYRISFGLETNNVLSRIYVPGSKQTMSYTEYLLGSKQTMSYPEYTYLAQNRQCLIQNIFWAQNTLKFRLRKLYTVVTLYNIQEPGSKQILSYTKYILGSKQIMS